MNKNLSKLLLCSSIVVLLILGCGKEKKKTSFDRKALLTHYTQKVLKPRIDTFSANINSLNKAIQALAASPNFEKFSIARDAYETSIRSWQYINFMNFGPGGREGLKLTIFEEWALFPIDTQTIDTKIQTQVFDIDDSRRYTRGLLTIEYLLYPIEDSQQAYTSLATDQARIDYLSAISEKLHRQVSDFDTKWRTYPQEFIAMDGTDINSSITLLYNEWIRSYEILKNMKIVEPMGLKAGQSAPNTKLVESRFAHLSMDLIKHHFESTVEIYTGSEGLGFDDYIASVDGGPSQVSKTKTQIENIRSVLNKVPADATLQQMIADKDPLLNELIQEMQVLLPYIKSEISSLLGLTITYSSADGD